MTRLTLTQRTARVLPALALVASACLYGVVHAGPAAAAQTTAVSLTSMSPAAATSSQATVDLKGRLTVPSGDSYSDVIVELYVQNLSERSEMSQPAGQGEPQAINAVQTDLGTVSGGTQSWELKTTVSQILAALGDSDGPQLFSLDAEVWSEGSTRLGALRTYLPYKIGTAAASDPVKLSVLAPITAPSPYDGFQSPTTSGNLPELSSDSLAPQMAPGGVLSAELTAAAALPKGAVSWAVDPDLLDTANAIEAGYVTTKGGAASDAANATAWLKQLKATLDDPASGELWQLPSTDPDLGSLSNALYTQAQPIVAAAALQATHQTTVKDYVGRAPLGMLAWPAEGQLNQATFTLAESVSPSAVVADSQSVDLKVPGSTYTPTGRASISGKDNVVVADHSLDSILSGDPLDSQYVSAGSSSTVLQEQRLLAETALIVMEKPSQQRDILVTLPRDAKTAALDLDALGTVFSDANWLKPAGLSSLLATAPDPNASTGTPSRSSAVTGTDLSPLQLDQALGLEDQVQLYESILTEPEDQTANGFAQAGLRTLSTGWRGDGTGWSDFETAATGRLRLQMEKVRLLPKSNLTLTGTTGSIAFTVDNGLDQKVRLGIEVRTSRTGVKVDPVEVRDFPANGSTTVNVKITASSPGAEVTVTAYLENAAGRPYGTDSGGSQQLTVSVTSYGFVALLLFAGSAALLLFAVGWRLYRGKKGRRPEGAETVEHAPVG